MQGSIVIKKFVGLKSRGIFLIKENYFEESWFFRQVKIMQKIYSFGKFGG